MGRSAAATTPRAGSTGCRLPISIGCKLSRFLKSYKSTSQIAVGGFPTCQPRCDIQGQLAKNATLHVVAEWRRPAAKPSPRCRTNQRKDARHGAATTQLD